MRQTRRRRTKTLVPVASMGDIAFLLIIFFILCSNFAKEAGITVTPPKSLDVAEFEKEYPVTVAIDEDGRIYFEGEEVTGPRDIEYFVAAALEGKVGEDARTVVFHCDESIGKELFEPVLDAIAKGGGRIAAVGRLATE